MDIDYIKQTQRAIKQFVVAQPYVDKRSALLNHGHVTVPGISNDKTERDIVLAIKGADTVSVQVGNKVQIESTLARLLYDYSGCLDFKSAYDIQRSVLRLDVCMKTLNSPRKMSPAQAIFLVNSSWEITFPTAEFERLSEDSLNIALTEFLINKDIEEQQRIKHERIQALYGTLIGSTSTTNAQQ